MEHTVNVNDFMEELPKSAPRIALDGDIVTGGGRDFEVEVHFMGAQKAFVFIDITEDAKTLIKPFGRKPSQVIEAFESGKMKLKYDDSGGVQRAPEKTSS